MGKRSREKKERRLLGVSFPAESRGERGKGLASVFKKVIRWGTYLVLFTPLVVSGKYFFPFVGPKSIYFFALVEIIFTAYLFLIFLKPEYRPRFNVLLIAIILFAAVLALSSFLGEDFSRSFWSTYERMTGLLMWFHLLGFFVVISSVFKNKEDWFKIFVVSIFTAILISLISLGQRIGLGISPSAQGGATIGSTSFMGAYLLFNVFLALYLFLRKRTFQLSPNLPVAGGQPGLKIYSGIAFLVTGLALLFSDARAAALSFLGGLVLLFFLYLVFVPQKRYFKILGKVLLAGSLLVFLLCAVFIFQPDNVIHQKFTEKATTARLVIWEGAWKGWQEKPWLGWGPENFELVFTKHFNPCMFSQECGGEVWFDRAHNVILDTLVSAGIVGFLSYLGIFASAFYVLWKKFFRQKVKFWTASIFSVILISYFVQNLTVFDVVNSYMMLFLVLGFLGSIASKDREGEGQKNTNSLNFLAAVIILIFFCLSFLNFVIQPLRTAAFANQAVQSQNPAERVSLYRKTLETSPVGKHQIREFFGDIVTNFPQSEAAKGGLTGDFKQELDFISEELEKSIKESPLDFRARLKLGQVYNVYAQINLPKLSEAEKILKEAIELSPANQQGYWSLVQTKLYQKEFEEALSLAEKAVVLEPRVFKSHLTIIQAAKIMGDYDLARKKIEEAIKIDPFWEQELKKILGG